MPLPVFIRTWQFQNGTVIAASGTALGTARNLLLAIKNAFLGAGAWTDATGAATASSGNWTVDYSCDSVTAGVPGDAVDRWAAAANLVWAAGAHSWTVLKQTGMAGGDVYVCIDLSTATVNQATIVISRAGFMGGTTLARPTAVDEVIDLGAGNWGMSAADAAQNLSVQKSADGKAIRVIIVRGGWSSGLWFFEEPNTSANRAPSWSQPFFSYAFGTSTTAPASSNLVLANFVANASVFSIAAGLPLRATLDTPSYAVGNVILAAQAVATDIGAAWPLMPVGVLVKSGNVYVPTAKILDGVKGRDGTLADLWWVPTAMAEGDQMPAAATKNITVFGDMAFPWDTTAAPVGGANVDGYELTDMIPYYGDMEPPETWGGNGISTPSGVLPTTPSLGSAVLTYYQMEASDSVDGLLYTWVVTGSPDWAGLAYATAQTGDPAAGPPPGLPLNIAKSGEQVR